MAEGAANVLVENLGASLLQRLKLCRDVRKEARNLNHEAESMRSFLRAAEEDDSVKTSVKRVREAVYDSEDVLDEYRRRLEVNREPGLLGFLRTTARSIKQLKPRWQIASQIQEVRDKIREIKRDYQGLGSNSRSHSNSQAADHHRLDALFIEESELVGIDVPRAQLMEILSSEEERLLTISVVGMGGLGKTTLVKKVYEQAKRGGASDQFETYAWISVSQTFQPTDILRNMIAEFYKAKTEHAKKKQQAPPAVDATTEGQLTEKLLDYLENERFLLVLDDVWSVDAFESLRRALPDRGRGSRVIFTTRSKEVARFSDRIVELKALDWEDAWSLFCRKAFPGNEENRCPQGFQTLAESFVGKCGGLPLAIVSLGSLLYAKHEKEWEVIHRSLGSEFETDHHLKRMKQILLLSFDDLPYHLKSCFLFLSIFPEDYPIKRMKLIRLWIGEGLIESKRGKSLEEVADGYLNQLIQRSLIQVSDWKNDETVKTCQVHDIVREIIILKYEEEGFVSFSSSSSVEPETMLPDRIFRRLSIYSQGETIPSWYEKLTRLHSIFIFGADNASSAIKSFAGFKWLRVVDLENVALESFPNDLTQLLHLRYLSLENTNIKNLPNSVGKLEHLETLNLKGTLVRELPPTIQKLQRLRHLLVYKYGQGIFPFQTTGGVKVPAAGIRKLRSLQKLAHIEADSGVVAELGNLTELRKLGVIKLRREDGRRFCASVAKMKHLRSMELISVDENVVLDLQSLECPPFTLERLHLYGRLENVPRWIPSLRNLVRLTLCWSRLKDDPLKALQSLANLLELCLENAYDGEELCCEAGGYPKLKELHLHELIGLKQVEVEKGAMPNLARLSVSSCQLLLKVPSCLQHLANMQLLNACYMPEEFELSLHRDGGEEQMVDYVRHIPHIHFRYHAS